MRKIKNFKLAWRVKEVVRRAKKAGLKLGPLGGEGFENEESLAAFLSTLTPSVSPAVLFDSYAAKTDAAALAPLPGLACSLGLATLGPAFDDALAGLGDSPKARWAVIAAQTALDQSFQFAGALIAEEAAGEKCELSPLQPLIEPAALSALLERLDGSKVGVSFRDGRLTPSFSAAFSVSWIAIKTRSRSGR